MIDVALTDAQRSIVEVDMIDGWGEDPETADLAPAISEHYARTGRLLVVDPERMTEILMVELNGFDARGEHWLRRACDGMRAKIRSACPNQTQGAGQSSARGSRVTSSSWRGTAQAWRTSHALADRGFRR